MTTLEHIAAAEQVRAAKHKNDAREVQRHYSAILERLKTETPDKDTLAGLINEQARKREEVTP